MEDREDSDLLALNAVREKVGSAGNDEFASSGMAACAAETRVCGELISGSYYPTRYYAGSFGFVLSDVGADFRKLGNGGGRPDYSHAGGGSSFCLPQESNQRRTSLWGMAFPWRNSASAFSMRDS